MPSPRSHSHPPTHALLRLYPQRVALAAKAVMHCGCGAVAVVCEEDFGNGVVSCPGCGEAYCAKVTG